MVSRRWASVEDAEESFAADPLGLEVFRRVLAVIEDCGGAELRVAPTQVGWARRRGFAVLWSPRRVLGHGADVVLSIGRPAPGASPRWKEITQVHPNLHQHHLEVSAASEIDAEVVGWITAAYDEAG